ncbi:phosphoglycerol transferase I [compost metagenome]
MTEDQKEWWGYRDTKLFDWSKEQLLKLKDDDKPFNFTMLTVDTHFMDGFVCDKCLNNKDQEQYTNVINCSSKQVDEFINWIKQQEFYKDTTIILVGDHLTMQPDFPDFVDETESYQKTVYMTIINTDKKANDGTNRVYSTLDMFPTTLYSIGADIQGDKLGLGTNLFSDKKTLLENYGYNSMKSELERVSKFYNKKFIYGE